MDRIRASVCFCVLIVIPAVAAPPRARLPWYMRATAMTPDGRLTFLDKPWWPRAKALAEGQSFTLDLNHDGRPDTVVERKDDNIIEAIDDSGRAKNILNKVDTAYLVSYHRTGLVDRMVAYIDNNHDGKADEMEIRYYKDGYLRFGWFGENYDNDGAQIFSLKNWQYDGNGFASKFRGNTIIYLNKYNFETHKWEPLSECPFVFFNPSHDGFGEIVARFAVAPLSSNTGSDLDYANNYKYMWSAKATPLDKLGTVNVRLSYSIDPPPRKQAFSRPHYNFGFTMVGSQPYNYPRMSYTNPRRRPPQTVIRIPWNDALQVALDYPAAKTGFTWDEGRSVHRWEGQFWIYERRLLYNTGGPTYRWNMRREYSSNPATRRQLYYSAVDKRYHLFGAKEGWLEVGHLVDDKKDMEIRYFDTNGDGYFDKWEVFLGGDPVPVQITRVSDPRTRMVPLKRSFLIKDYNRRVLPKAIAEDKKLIAEMRKFVSISLVSKYEAAAQSATMAERRRYCLDVARELYFIGVRDLLYRRDASSDYPALAQAAPRPLLERGPIGGRYTLGDTLAYWKLAREIEAFVNDYGSGHLRHAYLDLRKISLPDHPVTLKSSALH
ncbi:MAG: hypothetical protein M1404_04140 [Acidobacteria bacterium]|nr:hypothetical protein [Acidobacteriota bacterium]